MDGTAKVIVLGVLAAMLAGCATLIGSSAGCGRSTRPTGRPTSS